MSNSERKTLSDWKTTRSLLRATLDVELSYQVFRKIPVYDRHFQENFLRAQANRDESLKYQRDELPVGLDDAQLGHEVRSKSDDQALAIEDISTVGPTFCSGGSENRESYSFIRKLIFNHSWTQKMSRMERKEAEFTSIVDIDDEAFDTFVSDDLAGRFGEGEQFKFAMMVVIILNSMLIAVETDSKLYMTLYTTLSTLDYTFIAVFIMEIIFKWFYAFSSFWRSGWNIMDLVLVIFSVLGNLATLGASSRILKMMRVLRAFRSLRSVTIFRGMYTVLLTLARSIPDMLNICLLLLIIIFIFGVIGVSLYEVDMPERFGDLGKSMFTVFAIVTQDNWVQLFNDLSKKASFSVSAVYFASIIIIGGFVFLNLIVAVVVTQLEVTYTKINKMMKQKYRKLNQTDQGSNSLDAYNGEDTEREVTHVQPETLETFEKQIPFELPNFENINEMRLENYYLVLMIIEENLLEYKKIKSELETLLKELKHLNEKQIHDERRSALYHTGDIDDPNVEFSESEYEGGTSSGDALSRLIQTQPSNKRQ